jgi:hypothetical protein
MLKASELGVQFGTENDICPTIPGVVSKPATARWPLLVPVGVKPVVMPL